MGFSPSLPRQIPLKLTTAPISVCPFLSSDISRPMSKSASWIRMVTLAAMRLSKDGSAAGHRRKEGDLSGARDRRIRLDMGVVDGGADHFRFLEGVSIGLALPCKPRHQVCDRSNAWRRLDHLFRFADPFAHPRSEERRVGKEW